MAERHIVDEVGPIEFVTELIAFHGPKRSAEIIGQAIIWGLYGLQNKAEIIAFCQDRGVSHMTAYRLITDFDAFLRYLECLHGWTGTLEEGISEIRRVAA